jgi:AcrR family transcriptional regulator
MSVDRMALRRPDPKASRDDTPTVKVVVPQADPRKVKPRVDPDEITQRMPAVRGGRFDQAPVDEAPTLEAPAHHELSVHERLLNAARDRFSSDGYENATTASIARQAGTSESQLVKHFGSKEGLLEAIFDHAWAVLEASARQTIADQPSPVARVLAVSESLTRALERDRKLRSLVLLEGRRIRKNGYEVAISHGFRSFLALVDGLFQEMKEQGDIAPDVHLEAARSAWLGAIEGLLRDQLLAELMGYPATFNRKAMRRTSLAVLGAFLTPRAQRVLNAVAVE